MTSEQFFQRTYPTVQLQELIRAVFGAIAGRPTASRGRIVCLQAPPGAGKTHALRALALLTRRPQLECTREFVTADLLPDGPVRVAVIDGAKSDARHGIRLEGDLRAYTPWGELGHQLGGKAGIASVEHWDQQRTAPPPAFLRDLIESGPALIVVDRTAALWRRFSEVVPGGDSQISSFISGLARSVASSPRAVLVYTLATRHDPARDPYHSEHSRVIELLRDCEPRCFPTGVAPEGKSEVAAAVRRFLFKRTLLEPETYPVEAGAFDHLVSIVRALGCTHVFGGTLAVLGRTVHALWKNGPSGISSIRSEHLDLRPLAERLAYDRWEMNGRQPGSAQSDIEYAKRVLQSVTPLAGRIVI